MEVVVSHTEMKDYQQVAFVVNVVYSE